MKYHFKRLTLINELENGGTTDTDSDGLTDWEEFDSDNPLLAWDDNGNPVFPSFTTVSQMVTGFCISDKYRTEINGLGKFFDDLRVAPFDSDPTVEDTDGDGYSDYVEMKKYVSDALHNDVEIISLKSDYISIKNGFWSSYGGDQEWFEEDNEVVASNGCGLIAMADVCLYLAKKDFSYCSDLTNTVAENCSYFNEPIPKAVYMDYVKSFNDRYVDLHMRDDWFGKKFNMNNIDGNIGKIMSQYFDRNYINLKAKYCWVENSLINTEDGLGLFESTRKRRIKQMLKNDMPAIICIGPDIFNQAAGQKGIPFYTLENREGSGEPIYMKGNNHDNHYVTVTAVIKDGILGDKRSDEGIIYRISSWGKDYYIFESDIRNYICQYSSIMNNVVFIEEH